MTRHQFCHFRREKHVIWVFEWNEKEYIFSPSPPSLPSRMEYISPEVQPLNCHPPVIFPIAFVSCNDSTIFHRILKLLVSSWEECIQSIDHPWRWNIVYCVCLRWKCSVLKSIDHPWRGNIAQTAPSLPFDAWPFRLLPYKTHLSGYLPRISKTHPIIWKQNSSHL